MTTSRPSDPGASEDAQGGLFEDDDPKPNSPEDLGQVAPRKPPQWKPKGKQGGSHGKTPPSPDLPRNYSSNAVQAPDIRKFVDWIRAQDVPIHEDVTVGSCLVSLSGLGLPDLHWLCKAIRQAKRAPAPGTMKRAVVARDVGILRPGGDVVETRKGSKKGLNSP